MSTLPESLHYYRSQPRQPRTTTADVCVYGGSIAAITAAVQLRRFGHSVVLAINAGHAGGMTTSGLGFIDYGSKEAIGGLAHEFFRRTGLYYGRQEAWLLEPHVARQVVADLLREEGIEALYWEFLEKTICEGDRVTGVRFESGLTVQARYFIDATYEGDLLAQAGVDFVIGRESTAEFGEILNGFQVREKHQFLHRVSPYRVEDDPASGLLPGLEVYEQLPVGSGDALVQAYNFRLCLTNAEERIPFAKPEGYDPLDYELLARAFARGWDDVFRKFDTLPNQKVDMNNHGPVATDLIGGNHGFPAGSYEERERIYQRHVTYQKGLLWFLANDERVPAAIREEMNRWGLPVDEFTATGGWPPMMYIREARRMRSDYVITEHDCWGDTDPGDSIGLGAYAMDSHNCQRIVWQGHVVNEGDVQVSGFPPYPISYRAIIPRRGQCANLAVTVCASATHIAYGSLRMEPVFMALGQSAASAIHLALQEKDSALQDLSYPALRSLLLEQGQVLDWKTTNPEKNYLPASELEAEPAGTH